MSHSDFHEQGDFIAFVTEGLKTKNLVEFEIRPNNVLIPR